MKATLAPVRLEFYGVDNASFRSNPAFDLKRTGEGEPCPRIELAVGDLNDANEFVVYLEVHIEEGAELDVPIESVPCFVDIDLVGVFQICGEVDQKVRDWLVAFNAPAILYGIARAEVAHVTEHGPSGVFILPSVDFIAMARREVFAGQPGEEVPTKD